MSAGPVPGGVDDDRLLAALRLDLTAEQRAVVLNAPAGPAVVIAGAGSGKTAVMAARMAVLVVRGTCAADEVLGLTFTRKAAAELAGRVDSYLVAARRAGLLAPGAGRPDVSTYHAFAQRFVREYGVLAGIDPDLRLETDFALLPLAYRTVAASPTLAAAGAEHAQSLRDSVSWMRALDAECAEHAVDPQKLLDTERQRLDAFTRLRDEGLKVTSEVANWEHAVRTRIAFARLVEEFRAAKLDAGVMDFGDLMRFSHAIATGGGQAVDAMRSAYRAVLLDEYQDTSVVQRTLLQALFGDGHQVLAVGDPKQSIYGFRGAAAANITDFRNHFPSRDGGPAPDYALSVNFRSGAAIVEVANASAAAGRAARMVGGPAATLRVGRTDITASVHARCYLSVEQERDAVVADVLAELDAGCPPDEVIVLARSNDEVADYASALAAAGVPVLSSAGDGLLDAPEVADLLAELSVLVDPGANEDVMRLLLGPRWRIGARDLQLLGSRARELAGVGWRPGEAAELPQRLAATTAGVDDVELPSLADALADPGDAAYSAAARERFGRLHAELDDLSRFAGEPVPDVLLRIVRTTGMDAEVLLGPEAPRRSAAVQALLAVAAELHRSQPGSGPAGFLRTVRLARSAEVDPGFDPPALAGCVRVMTVHKAKGLQAQVVFLPGFTTNAYDPGSLTGHWTTTAGSLPDDLRGDRPLTGLLVPQRAADIKAWREEAKLLDAAESDRLVYVALTRAQRRLVVSAHWWAPGKAKPRGPSQHLTALAEHAVALCDHWEPAPAEGADNPLAEQAPPEVPFPGVDPHLRRRVELAERVSAAAAAASSASASASASVGSVGSASSASDPTDLPEQWRRLVQRWDDDIAALTRERAESREPVDVQLSEPLSVTALQHYLADPAAYALAVRRPMPRQPSPQARRGTRFHDWVASRWGQHPLLDDAELAVDADLDLDADADDLADLIAAFEVGPYADRRPHAVEYPFQTIVAGVPVLGRIDAVFDCGDGRWEVVDWKTSARESADPVQLAVYRMAWAQVQQVPADQVTAAFYYVSTARRVVPADLPDEEELALLLRS